MMRRLVLGLAAAFAVTRLIAFSGAGVEILIDAFLASALAGAALMAAVALPARLRLVALAVGVALELLLLMAFPAPPDVASFVVQRGSGLGLAMLAMLAWHARRSPEAVDALYGALVLPLFVLSSGALLDVTAVLHPRTLDGPCLWGDHFLGQPSYAAGMLFGRVPPLGQLCAVIYGELPLFCALVITVEKRGLELLRTFVAVGVLGYLLYNIFPVAGPRFAFAGWPGRVPPMGPELLQAMPVVPVPRNCMPSLHTAWVLLCAWYARGRLRWLAAFWVAGTLLATVGLGLHYGVDLIAAVPFLVAVMALVKRLPAASGTPSLRAAGMAFGVTGEVMLLAMAAPRLGWVAALLWLFAGAWLRGPLLHPLEIAAAGVGALAAQSASRLGLPSAAALLALPVLGSLLGSRRSESGRSWAMVALPPAVLGQLLLGLDAAPYYSAVLSAFALGLALGGKRRLWAVWPAALACTLWAVWAMPGYLALFADANAEWRALAQLGVAVWCAGPPALAIGMTIPHRAA